MTSLELLAPAKNLECGIAAIDHGADAVYIGAPRFGARAAAGNSVDHSYLSLLSFDSRTHDRHQPTAERSPCVTSKLHQNTAHSVAFKQNGR